MAAKPLSERHTRFVAAYLENPNGTSAYKAAGYKGKGDSVKAAAARLLASVNVQQAIKSARKATAKECKITQAEVVKRLDKESQRTGKSSTHGARVRACELLGKHIGMFDEKVRHEHTGKDGGPIRGETKVSGDVAIDLQPYTTAAEALLGIGPCEVPGRLSPDGPAKPVDPA